MAKREKVIPFILGALYVIPILLGFSGVSIALAGSISFALPSSTVNMIVTSILTLGAAALTVLNRKEIQGAVAVLYFADFAISMVLYLPFCIIKSSGSVIPIVLAAVNTVCLFVCCIVILPRLSLRLIFSAASAVPLLFSAFAIAVAVFVTLMPLTSSTLRETYTSPEGSYRIEVIDVDQGALGGSTVVRLHYEKPLVHLGLVKVIREPKGLYTGRWQERVSISWTDENTVVINGNKHELR